MVYESRFGELQLGHGEYIRGFFRLKIELNTNFYIIYH